MYNFFSLSSDFNFFQINIKIKIYNCPLLKSWSRLSRPVNASTEAF